VVGPSASLTSLLQCLHAIPLVGITMPFFLPQILAEQENALHPALELSRVLSLLHSKDESVDSGMLASLLRRNPTHVLDALQLLLEACEPLCVDKLFAVSVICTWTCPVCSCRVSSCDSSIGLGLPIDCFRPDPYQRSLAVAIHALLSEAQAPIPRCSRCNVLMRGESLLELPPIMVLHLYTPSCRVCERLHDPSSRKRFKMDSILDLSQYCTQDARFELFSASIAGQNSRVDSLINDQSTGQWILFSHGSDKSPEYTSPSCLMHAETLFFLRIPDSFPP